MFNRKILLLASAFSFWALGAQADAACVKQDCAALGYTKTLAQCSGANNIIKCPFDTSKVACNTPVTISSPIFDILYDYVFNVCDIERSLSADIRCLTDGYDQEMLCADLAGLDLNMDIMDISICLNSSDADPILIDTMQDLVKVVENILIAKVDPCAGAVEYDPEWQTCGNPCSTSLNTSGKDLCFGTPQAIACSTAIRNANGYTLDSSTTFSSGYAPYYLLNDVNLSEINVMGTITFKPAAELAACAHDSSVNQNPTLAVDDIYIGKSGGGFTGNFYIPTTINGISFIENTNYGELNLYADTAIKEVWLVKSAYGASEPMLQIQANTGVSVKMKIDCEDSEGKCAISLGGDTSSSFQYCNNSSSKVYCSGDGICTETCPINFK